MWDHVDIMVTDNPKILNTKPLDKLSIIIDKEYNEKILQSGHRLKTIKEIDERLLDTFEQTLRGARSDWIL